MPRRGLRLGGFGLVPKLGENAAGHTRAILARPCFVYSAKVVPLRCNAGRVYPVSISEKPRASASSPREFTLPAEDV